MSIPVEVVPCTNNDLLIRCVTVPVSACRLQRNVLWIMVRNQPGLQRCVTERGSEFDLWWIELMISVLKLRLREAQTWRPWVCSYIPQVHSNNTEYRFVFSCINSMYPKPRCSKKNLWNISLIHSILSWYSQVMYCSDFRLDCNANTSIKWQVFQSLPCDIAL